MPKKSLWSKSVTLGKYTVRIYEPRPGGNLMRSFYLDGKERRKSLGHKDRGRAEEEIQTLLEHLQDERKALKEEGSMTLGMLADLYLSSASHLSSRRKKTRTRSEDRKKIERMVTFFGPARRVKSLSEELFETYAEARLAGDPELLFTRAWRQDQEALARQEKEERRSAGSRRRPRKPNAVQDEKRRATVGPRAVEADLVALQTMLNWAATKGKDHEGDFFLPANPLKGVSYAGEKNPNRPVLAHDEYLELLKAAPEVNPLLRYALVVAEGTGRRLSAWRQLRWSDIRFDEDESGAIHWPSLTDKNGTSQDVPITKEVREALLELRAEKQVIGEAWVFPSPTDSAQPCCRHVLDEWLRQAYELAGLRPQEGGMWHPFRRKWVTERKGHPIKDLAYAGGWKSVEMVLIYLQEDRETVKNVVFNPTIRMSSGARLDSQHSHNTG